MYPKYKKRKYLIWEKDLPFLDFFFSVERERERERKISFDDSQDFVNRNSSGKELKFITSTRATRRHKKKKDFTEDPKEEIWGKSKFSGLRGVLETSYYSTMFQDVEIFPSLILFLLLG